LQTWAELSMKQTEEHRGTAASGRLKSGMSYSYMHNHTLTKLFNVLEFVCSKRRSQRPLAEIEHEQVTRHLQRRFPELNLRLSVRTHGHGEIVAKLKTVHSYVSVSGRVFRPYSQNGIVLARMAWGDEPDIERIGEIVEIFSHSHTHEGGSVDVYFAKVRWYIDTAEGFAEHAVQLWQHDA
jgi:hypothetical protein